MRHPKPLTGKWTWKWTWAWLVLLAVLVGCSDSDPDDGVCPPLSAPLASGNPGAWTFARITEANIAKAVRLLPDLAQAALDKTGVPGLAVAVVRADEEILVRGFGLREVGKSETVDADTVFQLASLSKPVGATVISRAVSIGTVSWSDPVVTYTPGFQIGDAWVTQHVTIGDLYAHRSGLPDHAGDDLEDIGFGRSEILQRLSLLPLSPFRIKYAYTNFGLTAAAEAVASAHRKDWASLSEALLYGPVGMTSTSSRHVDYLNAPNRAVTHRRGPSGWAPGPARQPDAQSPAGGVSSSASDMARWLRLQLGNGTLDGTEWIQPQVLQLMRSPQIVRAGNDSKARGRLYGYGMGTGTDGTGHVRWSHSGAFVLGTATSMVLLPAGDIAIVVLTNGQPRGLPEALAAQFIDIVETGAIRHDWLSLYEGQFSGFYINPSQLADQTPPAKPTPARPLADYVGTYKSAYAGTLEITLSGAVLEMALGPIPQRFPLGHWDGSVFSYFPIGENALGITAVTFAADALSVTVENLDEYGLGTFTR